MMLELRNLSLCNTCGGLYNAELAECPRPSCSEYLIDEPIPLMPIRTIEITAKVKRVNTIERAIETPQKGVSAQASISKKAKADKAPYMPVFNGIPSFSAIVAGQPLPKGRPRFNSQTKKTYTPETTATYEKLLIDAISKMVNAPFIGLLCVELEFCRATYVLADVDNLCKACLDAMNGILWSDDKQIRRLIADVSYGHEKPCVKIKVYGEWGE